MFYTSSTTSLAINSNAYLFKWKINTLDYNFTQINCSNNDISKNKQKSRKWKNHMKMLRHLNGQLEILLGYFLLSTSQESTIFSDIRYINWLYILYELDLTQHVYTDSVYIVYINLEHIDKLVNQIVYICNFSCWMVKGDWWKRCAIQSYVLWNLSFWSTSTQEWMEQ